jgi:prepilin-type N-terminal cleavage/methylation domain-containing protein
MPSRGFTLTELAVVLVLVALLMGGLLVPLSAQYELEHRRTTTQELANIKEALLGFAIQHGRLPCPADGSLPSGTAGAGIEAAAPSSGCLCTGGVASNAGAACTINTTVGGVLPWATLGLNETDAWGNRYTYAVTASYARTGKPQSMFYCVPSTTPADAVFAICTPGQIVVRSAATSGAALTNADETPAVVLSHGANGLGAVQANGIIRPGAIGDEAENGDYDDIFVSNTPIDDLVVWISRPILMNRMLTAGKLP